MALDLYRTAAQRLTMLLRKQTLGRRGSTRCRCWSTSTSITRQQGDQRVLLRDPGRV